MQSRNRSPSTKKSPRPRRISSAHESRSLYYPNRPPHPSAHLSTKRQSPCRAASAETPPAFPHVARTPRSHPALSQKAEIAAAPVRKQAAKSPHSARAAPLADTVDQTTRSKAAPNPPAVRFASLLPTPAKYPRARAAPVDSSPSDK